jgi:hypothetical protein
MAPLFASRFPSRVSAEEEISHAISARRWWEFGEDGELGGPHVYRLKRKPRMQVSMCGVAWGAAVGSEDGELEIEIVPFSVTL